MWGVKQRSEGREVYNRRVNRVQWSRRIDCGLMLLWLTAPWVAAQTSEQALRFYGTGLGPPGQQDRLVFEVDDNQPGPDLSTPIDIGAGSFTLELWQRGRLADNDTANAGGNVELFNYGWVDGNIFLDRDIWCGSERKFGASLAGGLVRFGVAAGDAPPFGFVDTIEGSVPVLDDAWHHVALAPCRPGARRCQRAAPHLCRWAARFLIVSGCIADRSLVP